MTLIKNLSILILLLIATSCHNDNSKLLIGKWELHNESSTRQMILNFRKDSIAIVKYWIDNKLLLNDTFSYKLTGNGKYLNLEPFNKSSRQWKNIEIVELNNNLLKTKNQNPDTSSLILNKVESLP